MKQIASDAELVDVLVGHNSILDAVMTYLSIYEEHDQLTVCMEFEMRPKSDFEKIRLKMLGVSEYSFYYKDDNVFYNVERIKFFVTREGKFYLSLDPVDDSDDVSDEDQDFVFGEHVVAFDVMAV
jgi:hypothetical protein